MRIGILVVKRQDINYLGRGRVHAAEPGADVSPIDLYSNILLFAKIAQATYPPPPWQGGLFSVIIQGDKVNKNR